MSRQILLARAAAQPWAMDPDHLAIFAGVLRRWSAGEPATPEIMATVSAAQTARTERMKANASVGGNIRVLNLWGVISQRASMVDDVSGAGGTSTQGFTSALRAAVADDTIGGIIISIDSPGGSVFGTGELAAEIFNARGKKPIFGFVDSLCASAAYWTGAQCSQLFITPGGQAGSIGVYMQHVDESAAMEKKGYRAEFISAGKYKVEGNSMGPLQADARAFMQSQIDSYYAAFTGAVAKGRGVPVTTVRNGMGQGRCLMASEALSAGMVDGICLMDEVVARLGSTMRTGGMASAPMRNGPRATSMPASVGVHSRMRELELAGGVMPKQNATTDSRRHELELAGHPPKSGATETRVELARRALDLTSI